MELQELKSELINTRNTFSVYPNDFEAKALATNVSWSIVESVGGLESYFERLNQNYRLGNYLVRIYGPNGRNGRIEKKNGVITINALPVHQFNGLEPRPNPVYQAQVINSGPDRYATDRISDLKGEISDLKAKLLSLETENKALTSTNQDLKLENATAETKKQYEIQQLMHGHKTSLAGLGSELVSILKATPEILPSILALFNRNNGPAATQPALSEPQSSDTVKLMLDQTAQVYNAAGDEATVQLFAILSSLANSPELFSQVSQLVFGEATQMQTGQSKAPARRTRLGI